MNQKEIDPTKLRSLLEIQQSIADLQLKMARGEIKESMAREMNKILALEFKVRVALERAGYFDGDLSRTEPPEGPEEDFTLMAQETTPTETHKERKKRKNRERQEKFREKKKHEKLIQETQTKLAERFGKSEPKEALETWAQRSIREWQEIRTDIEARSDWLRKFYEACRRQNTPESEIRKILDMPDTNVPLPAPRPRPMRALSRAEMLESAMNHRMRRAQEIGREDHIIRR